MHAPECFQYTCFGFSMGQVGFNYATKLWPRAGGGEGEGGGGNRDLGDRARKHIVTVL